MLKFGFLDLANQSTTIDESKRFYPMFGVIGHTGLIGAGILSKCINQISPNWDIAKNLQLSTIILIAILMIIIHNKVCSIMDNNNIDHNNTQVKEKEQQGLLESLKLIGKSNHIAQIALITISYFLAMSVIDVTWKKTIDTHIADLDHFQHFYADLSIYTGIITILGLLTGATVMRSVGWFKTAIVPPIVLLTTGSLFFLTIHYADNPSLIHIVQSIGLSSPIHLSLVIGTIQNIVGKSIKYAFFDPTKEMTYIPLNNNLKTRGKAAVDAIGCRFGKSLGCWLQQILITVTCGSQFTIIPYLLCILVIFSIIWLISVKKLSKTVDL